MMARVTGRERSNGGQNIVITRGNTTGHAGSKAPSDIREICLEMGFENLDLPSIPNQRFSWENLVRFAAGFWLILRKGLGTNSSDSVLLQHPIRGKCERLLFSLAFRRAKKIALIHDLDELRKPTGHNYDDVAILKEMDVIIAHNASMERFVRKVVPHAHVLSLGIFDYLTTMPKLSLASKSPKCLYLIGNLNPMKAGYIYKIGHLEAPLVIYGPNCDTNRLPEAISWKGVLDTNAPCLDRIDGFGLVWDGESPDRLEGEWGDYLRFNTPHKLSLYIILGLPVIAPRGSAMAEFVETAGIGLTCETVHSASIAVRDCSDADWQRYTEACVRLRAKLAAGFFTRTAVTEALTQLESGQ